MEAAAPGRAASGHEPHSGRRQLSLLQPRSGDISLATSVSWWVRICEREVPEARQICRRYATLRSLDPNPTSSRWWLAKCRRSAAAEAITALGNSPSRWWLANVAADAAECRSPLRR